MSISSNKLAPLVKLFRPVLTHHKMISFLIAMAVMIYCLYTIQAIFATPTDNEYRSRQLQKNTKTSFDKKTVDQIKNLHSSGSTFNEPLPEGRINPFIE